MCMAYLGRPDYCFRFREAAAAVVIGEHELCFVHNRAEGEAQLAADDLRVQRELFRLTAKPADADAAPDAVPEEFHAAKVHFIAGSRGGSSAVEGHQADIPVHRGRGRSIAAWTVVQFTTTAWPKALHLVLHYIYCSVDGVARQK